MSFDNEMRIKWGNHGNTEKYISKNGELPTYQFKDLKKRLIQLLEELNNCELEKYCNNRSMTIAITFEARFISELRQSAILAAKNFELRYFGTIIPEENKITVSYFMTNISHLLDQVVELNQELQDMDLGKDGYLYRPLIAGLPFECIDEKFQEIYNINKD